MKPLFCYLIVLLFVNLAHATPEVVLAPVDHLFIPKGFDNNDNIEVLVTGNFPNPCFIKNKVDVDVNGNEIRIEVTSLLRQSPVMEICAPLKVPFMEEVTIGNLQAGNYKLIINEGSTVEIKKDLVVTESSSQGVDDHIYAMVEYVETGFTGGLSGDAVLVAWKPDCLALDEVKYLSNGEDSISIMPIMKKIKPSCSDINERIQIPIKFDLNQFSYNKVLLFVRTMDGKSQGALISK